MQNNDKISTFTWKRSTRKKVVLKCLNDAFVFGLYTKDSVGITMCFYDAMPKWLRDVIKEEKDFENEVYKQYVYYEKMLMNTRKPKTNAFKLTWEWAETIVVERYPHLIEPTLTLDDLLA